MLDLCPKCNSAATVPIAYGKPGSEMLEAVEYGLLQLGGCIDQKHDRHCRRCGFEWCCGSGPLFDDLDHTEEVRSRVESLEKRFFELSDSLGQACMDGGRGVRREDFPSALVRTIGRLHEDLALFLIDLSRLGTIIVLRDASGHCIASYGVREAQTYVAKMTMPLYSDLAHLAQSCYDLGRADSVSAAQQAAAAVAKARESVMHLWQQMRRAALTGT